jgi:hypothetical protein
MSDGSAATGKDFVASIGGAVRGNPLPSALIGMGLVWLLTGSRSPLKAATDAAGDSLTTVGAHVTQGVRSARTIVADTAASAVEDVRTRASIANVRSTVGHILQEQPLLLGAIGLAIGAGVGASLATSDIETEYLGDTSAEFQYKARHVADTQRAKAFEIVSGVKTAIVEEARAQELTSDKLRSAAGELQQKIKDLADYAGTAVGERLP